MEKITVPANRPIGIFDSGIGGLTVANAINLYLPQEQIIYFGDTAHLPYGDKAPSSIKSYSERICRFLLEKNCKAIVIACNTASSIAFSEVQKCAGNHVPVINVIDPVIREVVLKKDIKRVGVIGTKGTIRSNVYQQKLKAGNQQLEVAAMATPLLVPVIEEMHTGSEISRAVIKEYLSNEVLKQLDVLILGCTHYPLIKNEIEHFYQGRTSVINSADIVGRHVQDYLKSANLLSERLTEPHRFYVSDYTESFEKSTISFFGKEILLEELNLWA